MCISSIPYKSDYARLVIIYNSDDQQCYSLDDMYLGCNIE